MQSVCPWVISFRSKLCLLLWWHVFSSFLLRFPCVGLPSWNQDSWSPVLVCLFQMLMLAAQGFCEDWQTSLLKLVFQFLNSVGWSNVSMIIASTSLIFWSSTTRDSHCSFCTFNGYRNRRKCALAGGVLGAAAHFEAAFGIACSPCKNSSG